MIQILEAEVNLDFPLGHHLHCLVAQIPVRLRATERGFAIRYPEEQWHTLASVLDLVVTGDRFEKLQFVLFPEAAVPAGRLDDLLSIVEKRFRPSTVTMFGMKAVPMSK